MGGMNDPIERCWQGCNRSVTRVAGGLHFDGSRETHDATLPVLSEFHSPVIPPSSPVG